MYFVISLYSTAMAKYLGIDYGTKHIGIAISDDTGSIAFPKIIFENDQTLLPRIIDLVRDENISVVVIGESRNKDGIENSVMNQARSFIADLERSLSVVVYFEPEYYSSIEARRDVDGSFSGEHSLVDAKAAAIILNRYLERLKNQ